MILNSKRGFTLIEVLVSVSLVGVILMTVTLILSLYLRSVSKENISLEAKENGVRILNIIEALVRDAKDAEPCDSQSSSTVQLLTYDNQTVDLVCDSANGQIASNSASGNFILNDSSVKPKSCDNFVTCFNNPPSPKRLEFSFELEQLGVASLPVFKKASAAFKTSIGLRNY